MTTDTTTTVLPLAQPGDLDADLVRRAHAECHSGPLLIVHVTNSDELWDAMIAHDIIAHADWQRPRSAEEAEAGYIITLPCQDGHWLRLIAPDRGVADDIAASIFGHC